MCGSLIYFRNVLAFSSYYYIILTQQTDQNMPNKSSGYIELISILLYVVVSLRIFLHKKNTAVKILPDLKTKTNNNFSLSNLEKQTIADATTNFLIVLGFASYTFVFLKLKQITAFDFNFYPNYLYIFFHQLIYPVLMGGMITISYYVGHPPLRKTIAREARNCLGLHN